jgi:hypothetical protein
MDEPRMFREALIARVLLLVRAAAVAVPPIACNTAASHAVGAGGGSTSSASGAGGVGSDGAGGGGTRDAGEADVSIADASTENGLGDGGAPSQIACFPLEDEGGTCPTDLGEATAIFVSQGCYMSWETNQVVSGPVSSPPGQCCYMAYVMFCPPGSGGRPFRIDGCARVAAAQRGAGWSQATQASVVIRADVSDLTTEERAALAEAWSRDALQEHASVAAFGRFALALLRHGAPADLVAAAHEAALDEVTHARLCFALASAYAGEPIAPGPFPFGTSVEVDESLAALAVGTVIEGCVAETISACVAAEQLAHAVDPAVRAALARIATDEARHAELAFRTIAWALHAGGSDVRAAVRAAFDGACEGGRPTHERETTTESTLGAHGRLSAASEARVRATTLHEVVAVAAVAVTGLPSRLGEMSTAVASAC